MEGMRELRTATAALVLVALTAACGSTVEMTSSSSLSGDGLTPGAVVPGTTGGTTVPGAGGQVPGAGVGTPGQSPGTVAPGSTGGTGGTGGAGTVTPGRGGAPASALPVKGRGWDKDFVYIGVTTQKDVNAVAQSVGANGLDGGDQEGEARAVADEVNRRGGLFGRKVKLVFRDLSTVATKQDPNTQGNAVCTFFTQDQPVVAVLSPVTLLDVPSFRSCLARARLPLFSASVAAVDDKVGAALAPYFYQSVAPSWNALAPVLVRSLRQQGWFTGWDPVRGAAGANPVKVGVLVKDDDVEARVGQVIKAALVAGGTPAGSVVVYAFAEGGDMSPAVLNFNGNGVTHVIASNADLFPFQLAANNQGYRPRYGVTSYNAPVTFLQTNSPPGQNNGALGVGWSTSLDVDDRNDPGDTNPGERECRQVMAKAGHTFTGKRLAEAVAFAFCDGINLIVTGAVAGGGLTGAQIYQGVLKQAPSFRTAFGFSNALGPKRLFIPGAVRPLAFHTECACFRYGGKQNLPL